jgi:hypothetical protein
VPRAPFSTLRVNPVDRARHRAAALSGPSGPSRPREPPLADAAPGLPYRRIGTCRTPSTGSSRTWTIVRASFPPTRTTTVYEPTGTSCR